MVIKMMWGKKHISIEDVISERQIKFSGNLQNEAAEKCPIQSIQVEEIVQITKLHR
jgi:ferredoxin